MSAGAACRRGLLVSLAGLLLGACTALAPSTLTPPTLYLLDRVDGQTPTRAPADAPSITVARTRAAAGFDSARIAYVRSSHRLEYFAHSEWVDPPAAMLAPLLVATLADSGAFRAVMPAASAATSELWLDSEIVRLQQDFRSQPSHVRFTLRGAIVDTHTRRLLGWREFDADVAAASDDPPAGVAAANEAVQTVLAELARFCVAINTAAAVANRPAPK